MEVAALTYEYPGVTSNCGGGGHVTKTLNDTLREQNVDVNVVTDPRDGSMYTYPARRYGATRRATERADVVHGHFSIPSSVHLPIAARDRPLVVTVMGSDVYNPIRFNHIRPVLDVVNHVVFSAADRVVAPSRDMAARIPDRYSGKTVVVPHGLDTTDVTWRERDAGGTLRLVTVARQIERKNLMRTITAVQALRETGINVKHRIAGTGPLHNDIQTMAAIDDWLTAPGYIDDLEPVYEWGDVFVLASHYEAFGMVYLEALARGLPVVMGNSGGQTDILQHGDVGVAVDAHSVPKIRDGIERVYDGYAGFQAATKDYVEEYFSATAMTNDYLDVYNEVT